jgi:DNA helicase II / ATP-dependent DNA helicase PcrA
MDLLSKLNPEQRAAVEHGNGPALVLAGAGSGKTRVITFRIAYLIRNGATRPENVLAVTFTNKAAAEMRDRVHALMGPRRSSEPLISTFHSFCVRLLRREIHQLGYRRDFSIYDTDDQKRLMKQLIEENKLGRKDLKPREVLSRISFAKNHGVPADRFAEHYPSEFAADIEFLFQTYSKRLRQANALDFDDLLLKSVELLKASENTRRFYSDWYRYILVDEYQDTNRPQYELLSLLTTAHDNLFVVGDEDQSIYKFRGADIQNILRFEKNFPGARVIKLEQNYRSTQNILQVAGAVVGNNTERKGKTLWTENPAGDVVTCHRARTARSEAAWICERAQELLEGNPEWKIAVLYRANFLSRNFEDVFMEAGVPYAVVGSVAFFGRMEVKDMLAYLRLLFNPEDDVALLRIINTPARGIGATTVEALTTAALEGGIPVLQAVREFAQDPKKAGRANRALSGFLEMFDRWAAVRDTASPAELLGAILADTRYREMLQAHETAEDAASRLENIEELIRATEESSERGETVFEFLDRASLSSELDQLDANARVVLMTLHSAKGLEFDAVFLAGLEEGLFPHSLSSDSKPDLEEERRLCYVGITRARRKLHVTWTPFRRSFGSDSGGPAQPSRFLAEMPHELLEESGFEESFVREDEDGDETEGWSFLRDEPEEQAVRRFPQRKPQPLVQGPQPKTIAELRTYLNRTQTAAPAMAGKSIKSGVRVRHPQFGDGIVMSREKVGNDFRIVVTFSRVGRKTLVERFAKLEIL